MPHARRTCVCFGFVAALAAGCGATAWWGDVETRSLVRRNNAFALDLYEKLRAEEGNLFFSPYSISTALAMTYAGARGETEKQMAEVMHFGLFDPTKLHGAFERMNADIGRRANRRRVELTVANALWGQIGYAFRDEFLELVRTHYGAGLMQVDFVKDATGACGAINSWVEKQTKGRITGVLDPGALDDLTRLVLTSAIYFKAAWASPFDPDDTKPDHFRLATGDLIPVAMMLKTGRFAYGEAKFHQLIELPYAGKGLSMLIVLPRKADRLPDFENWLPDMLETWARGLRRQKVHVLIPRFRIETSVRLSHALQAMGMTDAFAGGAADFSGIVDREKTREPFFIDDVLHAAFVEVSEKGTEAAAATTVELAALIGEMPSPVPVFRADRPFLFLIRDRRSGSILFMGRVVNPQEDGIP